MFGAVTFRPSYGRAVSFVPLIIEPDPEEPGCARILVDVALGHRPYRLCLDTGAVTTQVLLDKHTAGYRSIGTHTGHGLFAASEVDVILLPSLSVAGLAFGPLQAQRVEQRRSAGHGLLGLDVLGRYPWRLDLQHSALYLLPRGPRPSQPRARPTPPTHDLERGGRGHLFLEVAWSHVRARACLDTGADITLVDERFAAEHPELLTGYGSSTGTDATGAQASAPTAHIAPYRIGEAGFVTHVAAVTPLPQHDGPMDLVLGYPTLSQAEWVLDMPSGQVAIEPYA